MGAKKYAYVNYKMLVWARSETPLAQQVMLLIIFLGLGQK